MTKSLEPFRFLPIAMSSWMNQQQLQLMTTIGKRTELCATNCAIPFGSLEASWISERQQPAAHRYRELVQTRRGF